MGGTFNPIHLGHLQAAEEIAEIFDLNNIYFIPAAWPPHKYTPFLVNYKHRVEMIKLAINDHPTFQVSEVESLLSAPSYTINTIKAFNKIKKPEDSIFFLVGLDSFMSIAQWHQFRELLAITNFIVLGRSGISYTWEDVWKMLQQELDPDTKWDQQAHRFTSKGIQPIYYQPRSSLGISSTSLRARLEAGNSVRCLVPESVRIYIDQHDLYRPEQTRICPEER